MNISFQRCLHCGQPFSASEHQFFCPNCTAEQLNREKARLQTQLARAESKGLAATLSLEEWLQTLADFGGLCAYCQERPFEHLEHFIPIDAGGGTSVDNCIPACGKCNWSKGADDPDRAQMEFFVNDPRERVRNYLAARIEQAEDNLPWFD
jgi:5-methylcytosine-specific restriction endonuclease McrA